MQSRNGVLEHPAPCVRRVDLHTQRLYAAHCRLIILLFACFVQGTGSFCLRTKAPCMGIQFRTRRFLLALRANAKDLWPCGKFGSLHLLSLPYGLKGRRVYPPAAECFPAFLQEKAGLEVFFMVSLSQSGGILSPAKHPHGLFQP